MTRRAVLGGGLVATVCAVALSRAGVPPFPQWLYSLAWFPLLAAGDAGLGLRTGRAPLADRPRFALALFLWSVPAWLLWEIANLRLANWYYVGLPRPTLLRLSGAALAFSTVLPALFLGYRWARELGLRDGPRRRGFRVRAVHLHALRACGLLFLALALGLPRFFFPLIWGAVTLLVEPWNWRRDPARSLFGDLSRGRTRRILALLAGGMAVGLVWEALNASAGARWIYTVPGLEEGKLFEMPLPGFLGFPVLALDGFALYQALVLAGLARPGWDGRADAEAAPRRAPASARAAAALAAAAFCVVALLCMDRSTVDALAPRLRELPGVTPAAEAALAGAGLGSVRAVAEATPARIAEASGLPGPAAGAVRDAARLADLRGLGSRHAAALSRAGIGSICDLAAASPERVGRVIHAADPRPHVGRSARVRVAWRAANRSCPAAADTLSGARPHRTLAPPRQPTRRIARRPDGP